MKQWATIAHLGASLFGKTIICSMAGNSELETVIKDKFKHSRYYVSSGYLQKKNWTEPGETIFFRCSKAANPVASYGI